MIGIIDLSENSGRILDAPSTVHVGDWFVVSVTTRGDSCVRADGADIEVRGTIVVITPRDIV
ncbi:MAG: hypothetical protein ACJ78J_06910, partial [Gemmatimonadaceae bacterium]